VASVVERLLLGVVGWLTRHATLTAQATGPPGVGRRASEATIAAARKPAIHERMAGFVQHRGGAGSVRADE
jgi:hypothetical protein